MRLCRNMKFCPRCGKSTEHLVKDLCQACFLQKQEPLEGFKETAFECCTSCGAVKAGAWVRRPDKDLVERTIIKSVRPRRGVIIRHIRVTYDEPVFGNKNRVQSEAAVRLQAVIDDTALDLDYEMPISFLRTRCPSCMKAKSGYFEGILQLRPRGHRLFDDASAYIRKDVGEQKERDVAMTKIDERKEGDDFYITRKMYLRTLAKKVTQRFGGDIEGSSKLVSRDHQTSKDLTRLTVLVRLTPFEPGDVVIIKNKILLITRIKATSIFGIDIDSNKKTNYNYRQFRPEEVCKRRNMEPDGEGYLRFAYEGRTYRIRPDHHDHEDEDHNDGAHDHD